MQIRMRPLNGGRYYVAEASVTVDGRKLVASATGNTALVAAASAAEELDLRVRPSGDDAPVLLPGEWVEWAREACDRWRWEDETLVREWQFRDFDDGMEFLTQVGPRAEDHHRHPAMSITDGRVRMAIANPHHAGITLAELRLAAKVDSVVDELGAAT